MKLKKVIKTGRPHDESDQARTPSLKVMLTLITENRLELFRLIHDRKPNSLYELARLFNRDLGYVSKEVRILEALGLIKFEKRKINGRDCLQPRALYDRIVFDFDLASKLVS